MCIIDLSGAKWSRRGIELKLHTEVLLARKTNREQITVDNYGYALAA